MKRKVIMVFAALLILGLAIQLVSSQGPPYREPETVSAGVLIEPETLNLNSNAKIYATITFDKYDVTKIVKNSVLLTTPDDKAYQGYFDSYNYDADGIVISAKYLFDRTSIIGDMQPSEDVLVPVTVTGDIGSRNWDISFEGTGILNIVI
jgi:hypothetical protein